MDIKQAWDIVQKAAKEDGVKVRKKAWDDGEFFIFDYVEDLDISPLAVNKHTGEVNVYFSPDHYPASTKLKRVI